jgi:plasmid stability protein
MSRVIQVRDVPDDMHAVLRRRAAEAALSLSDYVRRELEFSVQRDENAELLRRLAVLPSAGGLGAAAVRAVRDDRESELSERVARR